MTIPVPSHPLVVGDKIDAVWLRWLRSLPQAAGVTQAQVDAAITTALAGIPEAEAIRLFQGAGIIITPRSDGYVIASNSVGQLFAEASGTNTITATFAVDPELVDGLQLYVRAAGANTGAVTFNPNGMGALALTKQGGTALSANDIAAAGHELILRYRESVPRWELLNPAASAGGGGGGVTTDDFDFNSISSYTQYGTATWTVNDTVDVIAGTGALQSILVRNGVLFADGIISCEINQAEDAGLVLRASYGNDYYVATIKDASAGSPNEVRIYKRIGGAFTQLGSTGTIAFTRNTLHTFSFEASGTSLVAKFDGVTAVSVTDGSITAAGKAGLRAGSGSANQFDSLTWP